MLTSERQRRLVRISVALVIATWACAGYQTRAAIFPKERLLEVGFDTIVRYAYGLQFVTELGQSDLRHVNLEQEKGDTVKGALLWIQPERASYRLSWERLRQGAIIARVWSDTRYPTLGLGKGWTWWWVDSTGGDWRSVFISESERTRTPGPLKIVHHTVGADTLRWDRAIARIVPGSVGTWNTCPDNTCCQR